MPALGSQSMFQEVKLTIFDTIAPLCRSILYVSAREFLTFVISYEGLGLRDDDLEQMRVMSRLMLSYLGGS